MVYQPSGHLIIKLNKGGLYLTEAAFNVLTLGFNFDQVMSQ